MASGRGLSEIVLAQLGALNFFVWAVANSMSSTQLRTYTGIEYIVYMYNLGTAPNVQNLPEIADVAHLRATALQCASTTAIRYTAAYT